jgi:hypothetical protein
MKKTIVIEFDNEDLKQIISDFTKQKFTLENFDVEFFELDETGCSISLTEYSFNKETK